MLRALFAAFAFAAAGFSSPAFALEPLSVRPSDEAVDLTRAIERPQGEADRVQVATIPGADGIVRRIEVRAEQPGDGRQWVVFALKNEGDEQIDRLLVAPRFRFVGSGAVRPDLGETRIRAVTASEGIKPERQLSDDDDVFAITLDPGATVTYVAELASPKLLQLTLWQPDLYEDKVNGFSLYRGIMLGISGLLALILTILFVVKGSVMFPAAAALAWAVLFYLGVDFGFWRDILSLNPEADRILRAGGEAAFAATLLVFLFAYLNLNRWHVRYSHVVGVWLVFLIAVVWLAAYDAPLAAGIARISLAVIATLGFGLIVFLAAKGYDRAVMLGPTWLLLLIWVAACGAAVTGMLANALVAPALTGALVLIVLLIGFTVMQHAFAGGAVDQGAASDIERRALAVSGSGDIVWDWDVEADQIHASHELETALGLRRGALQGAAADWAEIIHVADRDRFRAALDALVAERRGRLAETFRLRGADGHYLWYMLRARPVVGADGAVVRCIGTLLDVNASKTTEERLLTNAVRDSLTGLPNRQLFIDRIETALAQGVSEGPPQTVMVFDVDRYRKASDGLAASSGDTVLITVARRLAGVVQPQDTLARLGPDQFGVLLTSARGTEDVAAFAEALRSALSAPISFGDRQLVLTASIGQASLDGQPGEPGAAENIVKNAEVAMYHARRFGGDHVEAFRPSMRAAATDRLLVAGELARALERREIHVQYQPIVRLDDRSIAGFEAMIRWEHPRYGRRPQDEIMAIAEEAGLAAGFGRYALDEAAVQLRRWQDEVPGEPPLFVALSLPGELPLQAETAEGLRVAISHNDLPEGTLRLVIPEALVMRNPEWAVQTLTRFHGFGVGLALDGFGAGHSSLGHLQRLPFATLRIDRGFTRPKPGGERPAILRSLIGLARDLGMEVEADGVDVDSDAVELFHLGCVYARGYAFGDPMSVEDSNRLLGLAVPSAARRMMQGALRRG